MGEKLSKALEINTVFNMELFGYTIPVVNTIVVMWIIMAFLIASSVILTRKLETIPKGKQNFVETFVEWINNFAKKNIGHEWRLFAPYIGTVLLFLFFANTISIFNIIPEWEQLYHLTGLEFFERFPEISLVPPTKDINVTACLAIVTIGFVMVGGIRVKKLSGWLKSFIEPVPVLLPFKMLDYFIRPLSLCFRLFGNILGAYIVMELANIAIPIALPAALSVYFDLFDGGLQAYVFVFLTSTYFKEAVE